MLVSPGGENVYAGIDGNGVAIFGRTDAPPVCSDVCLTVPPNTASAVKLACTDSDGNALAYSVVSGPSHGTLGTIDQTTGRVSYTPSNGYSGPDSFTYRSSDGENSNVATVSLVVSPQPGSPPPPPPPVIAAAPRPNCVVPNLRHKTLKQARQLLARSHCKLGKARASAAARRRGKLRVTKSSPRAGAVLPNGARVSVRLGSSAKPAAPPKPHFTG